MSDDSSRIEQLEAELAQRNRLIDGLQRQMAKVLDQLVQVQAELDKKSKRKKKPRGKKKPAPKTEPLPTAPKAPERDQETGPKKENDAVTSPWHFDSNNGAELIYGNSGLVKDVCPGEITTLSYGVGNLGKRSFSLASRLEVEIVFSSNTTISTGDTPMGAFNLLTVAVGEFRRVNTLLFVPNSLTPGQTYHVGVIADPEGDFSEDDELNNSSQTGLRLFVRTSGC